MYNHKSISLYAATKDEEAAAGPTPAFCLRGICRGGQKGGLRAFFWPGPCWLADPAAIARPGGQKGGKQVEATRLLAGAHGCRTCGRASPRPMHFSHAEKLMALWRSCLKSYRLT
jgi:hypothetical protein